MKKLVCYNALICTPRQIGLIIIPNKAVIGNIRTTSFIIEMMNYSTNIFLALLSYFLFMLSSCSGARDSTLVSIPYDQELVTATPSVMPEPPLTNTPAPTFTPTFTPIVILEPEPVEVNFTTDDGVELEGLYYPADENPAPLIILIHWARGDMTEWEQIALWLQNRGQLVRSPDYNESWKSSDWFPSYKSEDPLGVLVFTMRDCQGGCQSYSPSGWQLDIEAVMLEAVQLQGVDKDRIITAGASIGGDGAIFGCSWLNQSGLGSCEGSFALSPASLLTLPYNDLADQLTGADPPLPVYCLFGLRDDASVETCSDLSGITPVDYGYIENHGFELIQPGQNPDPLVLLNEFINISLSGVGE